MPSQNSFVTGELRGSDTVPGREDSRREFISYGKLCRTGFHTLVKPSQPKSLEHSFTCGGIISPNLNGIDHRPLVLIKHANGSQGADACRISLGRLQPHSQSRKEERAEMNDNEEGRQALLHFLFFSSLFSIPNLSLALSSVYIGLKPDLSFGES